MGNQLTTSVVNSSIKNMWKNSSAELITQSQLINNFKKIMFKSRGGKFSSVFGTSKDKRNQETPSHTGNSAPRKLLKILFDCLP